MIHPDNPDGDLTELEPLHKVLPAGGPLVSTYWTCPTCGLSVRGSPPRACMNDGAPGCPIGGDL